MSPAVITPVPGKASRRSGSRKQEFLEPMEEYQKYRRRQENKTLAQAA